jgi:hypothetical protein
MGPFSRRGAARGRAQFHLQRQTAITTELLDIVSGYEALTGRS